MRKGNACESGLVNGKRRAAGTSLQVAAQNLAVLLVVPAKLLSHRRQDAVAEIIETA
jgi:hypothetical protein